MQIPRSLPWILAQAACGDGSPVSASVTSTQAPKWTWDHYLSKMTLGNPAESQLQFPVLPHGGSIAPVFVSRPALPEGEQLAWHPQDPSTHLPTWEQLYFPSAKVSGGCCPSSHQGFLQLEPSGSTAQP